MTGLGRLLVIMGLVLAGLGLLVLLGDRLPFRIGRLPGDIVWKGKNSTVYFPVVTCLLVSVVLSLVLWAVGRK